MKKTIILTVLFVLLLAVVGETAEPRSYSVDKLAITAALNPDGSASIVEKITMTFKGEYTRFTRDIPIPAPLAAEDIVIEEDGQAYVQLPAPDEKRPPGHFAVFEKDGKKVIEFYYKAKDTTKTFEVSYLLKNAVFIHNDVAELNRKFIDKGWESISEVNIDVLLPPGAEKDDILIWSHAPLTGEFEKKSGEEAVFGIRYLSKDNPVELRVMAPLALFPDGERKTGKDAKAAAIKQEKEFADEANRRREAARQQMEEEEQMYDILGWGLLGVAVFNIVRVLRNWRDKIKFPQDAPQYYRDLPSGLTPAEAGKLCQAAKVAKGRSELFTATLIDLCVKGFYTMKGRNLGEKNRPKDIFIKIFSGKNETALQKHERTLLKLIKKALPRGGSLEDFKDYIENNKEDASDILSGFEEDCTDNLVNKGYIAVSKRGGIQILWILLAIATLILAFWAMSGMAILASFIALFLSCLAGMSAGGKYRPTEKGIKEAALWRGMKNFFNDFTLFDEKELPELPIWERFLAYAVALGEAEKLLKELPLKYPQMSEDIADGLPVLYYISDSDVYSVFDDVGSELASAATWSSSSSDGGSWSDGGGDGGGSSGGDSGGDSGGGGSAD